MGAVCVCVCVLIPAEDTWGWTLAGIGVKGRGGQLMVT